MTLPIRRVVIHGHYYQPPREDPWLEEIARQEGAAPYHDWNERIDRECYRAVTAARLHDRSDRIARVVNLLSATSFNVGPTLLEWMEHAAPATYAAILEADRKSVRRLGHGNALAQPYHHVILPLASRRDKRTEVRWGIADFRRRFGRDPEGMWLPECAVDAESLDVLAQEGIRFTILGPSQVVQAPRRGKPGMYTTMSGRQIAICIYDGDLSHGVAFGPMLRDARLWRAAVLGAHEEAEDALVSLATDGETYGHHHKFGELALARLLADLEHTPGIRITNFAEALAAEPALEPVTLVEPSSWSCTHGVDRWQRGCGCRMDGNRYPSQAWRTPLREGLNALRDGLDEVFQREGTPLFHDPWAARDAYGAVVAAPGEEREQVVQSLLRPGLDRGEQVRARELLELARDGLRMFTSCAWFFDDLAGIETVQTLRYAARALELAGVRGKALEAELVGTLAAARGNDAETGTGEDLWIRSVRQLYSPMKRLAAGAGAAAAFAPGWRPPQAGAFAIEVQGERVVLVHRRTGRRRAFDVRVTRRGRADVHAYVIRRRELDDAPIDASPLAAELELIASTVPIPLKEFTERKRAEVRSALRRHLARQLLGDETLARVADGDVTLVEAVVQALMLVLTSLPADPGAAATERALALLDLLELLGMHIPFDIQTRFAQAVERIPRDQWEGLGPLAWRLGFGSELLHLGRPQE